MDYEEGLTRYTEGNATWEFHYDDEGVVTRIVDPYGGEELRRLDERGRISVDVDSGGRERRWLYDENGFHYARVDRFGHVFPPESQAPDVGNPFARSLPHTSLAFLLDGRMGHDAHAMLGIDRTSFASLSPDIARAAERCFRSKPPPVGANDEAAANAIRPSVPKLTRDRLGRKIREEDALGRVRTWSYDACGNLVSKTDRDGHPTTQEITSWNLVGARYDPMGHGVRYEYSQSERITAIIDPVGNESRYEYDLKNRLIRIQRHGRLRESYVYDAGDHFIQKRDGDGNVLFENTIHANHLVAKRQLASGGHHQFDYDARGRITEASTEAHRVHTRYGARGRRIADLRDGLGVEHRHEADNSTTTVLGRFEQRESWRPSSERRASEHDAGVLTSPTGKSTRLERREPGLVHRQCPNGTAELLQFDEDGRLEASLRYRRGRFGAARTESIRYSYSPEGDLLASHDSERGITRYAVDPAHRLDSMRTPRGAELTPTAATSSSVRATSSTPPPKKPSATIAATTSLPAPAAATKARFTTSTTPSTCSSPSYAKSPPSPASTS
jgi:YD repeat-containing protein